MKTKTVFNIAAIKKNAKNGLYYYRAPEKIFLWDEHGFFAFMIPHVLFDAEITSSVITHEKTELPQAIKNVFTVDYSDYNIITRTQLYIELANAKKPVQLLKCNSKNYFVPVNDDFIKMLNYANYCTIYQGKENAPLLFVNDSISAVIMPIWNNGIKEKLQNVIQ